MSDEKKNEHKQDHFRNLIDSGSDIAGDAVGSALGFLVGGPLGIVVGAAAAHVLRRIGEEASERLLGAREKVRIGAVLALAAVEIKQRTEAGEKLRIDGFFDEKQFGRSDAEEVAESVLLKCQREAQEAKLPYMGHLLSNIAFNQQISTQLAHQIIKAAELLTYRQLCILQLAVVKQAFGMRENDYTGQSSFSLELRQLLYEIYELYQKGFISIGNQAVLSVPNIAPGKMTVQGLGADMYNFMGLAMIPSEDLVPIASYLK